jgi:predicted enzyme related to lactoylglutathione lyase
MMRIRGTDFVMYPVSDLAQAANFYRDVLGLPQEVYSEQWHWAEFNCGNVTLALKSGETLSEASRGGCIALAVEDLHAAHDELKQKGVRILSKPRDYSVCWAMEILDPDGNLVILHRRADGTYGQSTPNQ